MEVYKKEARCVTCIWELSLLATLLSVLLAGCGLVLVGLEVLSAGVGLSVVAVVALDGAAT